MTVEAISFAPVIRQEDDARMAFPTSGFAVASVGSPAQVWTKLP